MKNLLEKYQILQDTIRSYKRVVVGFSAGVDSTFLLKVAFDVLGKDVLAVTAVSPSYAKRELDDALSFVKTHGIPHRLIETKEFNLEVFSQNSPNRCYHCKTELYQKLQGIAHAEGYFAVLDGSNADDESDFRPGAKAVKEQKAVCPLREARLTKAEIRELSKQLNLPTFSKVASPCLSSRFPYGTNITPEKMAMVEKGENILLEDGFKICRLRFHDGLARIEIPEENFPRLLQVEVRKGLLEKLKKIGFKYITFDLQGFRSGSLNEVLSSEDKERFSK